MLGSIVIVGGLIVGAALWWSAGRRYDDAVTDLAPVPVGCTATLAFERTGTYTFFVESKGAVGEIDGDCQTDGREYDVAEADAPRVSLFLLDDRGDELDLARADGPSYDRAGRRGVGIRTVEIVDTGDYELTATATSDDAEVVVRVGTDPASGVTAMRAGGLTALVVGIGAGLGLILVAGRRRAAPMPAAPSGPQWPGGRYDAPLAPPRADVPMAPPYTPRPASYGPYRRPPARPEWQPEPRPPGGWPERGGSLPPPRPPG